MIEFVDGYEDVLTPEVIGGNKNAFDQSDYWNHHPITEIQMGCGELANHMRMRFGCSLSPWSSAFTGACPRPATVYHNVVLSANERITKVRLTHGDSNRITSLQIETNHRYLPRCGSRDGKNEINITGYRLLFISGKNACKFDVLRLHWGIT